MELYLDSVDFKEIEEAFSLGFLSGLTTTPTFMHRSGITNVDDAIVKLSEMVPVLQVEALGESAEEIVAEANRLKTLPIKSDIVFKIPISLEGVKACKKLTDQGDKVNIHLIYTLNQAYMAMEAGATYVCPLVGRLHDQGHDAMALIEQAVNAVEKYDYFTKIMVSSVRHPEHVRQALLLGAHTVTVPYKILKMLTENVFTTVGVNQFFEHTRLMTIKVKDLLKGGDVFANTTDTLNDAIIKMTKTGLGAVAVVDASKQLIGAFTDGDLRRNLQNHGNAALSKTMADFEFRKPITVDADALLMDAFNLFKKHQIDNIIVTDAKGVVGILDIQDLLKLGIGNA